MRARENVSWIGGDCTTTARSRAFSVTARMVAQVPPKLPPYSATRFGSTAPRASTASIALLIVRSPPGAAFTGDCPVPGESSASTPMPRSASGPKRSIISSLRLSSPEIATISGAALAFFGMRRYPTTSPFS